MKEELTEKQQKKIKFEQEEELSSELIYDFINFDDNEAFTQIFNIYEQRIFEMVKKIVKNHEDSKDVCQQAWMKIYTKLDTFKGDSKFFTWLYKVARHSAIDFVRSKNSRIDMHSESKHYVNKDGDVDFQYVHESLCFAEPHDREILTLHYLEDMSCDEISEAMNCPRGTVLSRLYYGRKRFRKIVEGVIDGHYDTEQLIMPDEFEFGPKTH